MNLITFIAGNWDVVLLAVSVIVFYRHGEIVVLKNRLFKLVIQAEKDFGDGTGELKKADVITKVYERLPKIITLIISPMTIERLLEAALTHAKKKWTENPRLHEYVYGMVGEVAPDETVQR